MLEMLFVSLFLLTQMIPRSCNRSLQGQWYDDVTHEKLHQVWRRHACSKKLNFYKSDITPLEEPFANDETLPIMDIIAEEWLENAPKTIEDLNDSSFDLLGDAITEVYGPSRKHQRMEDRIAEDTVEQAKVVSGSSKTVETEQPTVHLTTSTPENNWSPAMESSLLESVPIIVDTVMMPTTGDQDGDDQSGGGDSSSTASPVPVTQDNSDNIEITDEVAQHIKEPSESRIF
jgi:hypothetical protein